MDTFSLWLQAGIWDLCPGAITSDTLFCVKSLLADKAEIKRGSLTGSGLLAFGAPWEVAFWGYENSLADALTHVPRAAAGRALPDLLRVSPAPVVYSLAGCPERCPLCRSTGAVEEAVPTLPLLSAS